MSITYSKVRDYRERLFSDIEHQLRALEDLLALGRDQNQVPVYLTKWRVKSIDSIYLKTKRKNKVSLDELTDIGGLRILCMFEQDLTPVHKYLVDLLSDKDYNLLEFKVFNWHDESFISTVRAYVDKAFKNYDWDLEDRQGAYKSIHYVVSRVVGNNICKIEIQLRTLLQDVWAELEHVLVYKKPGVHPHIRKSFSLLARDLETNDLLITHLRDISEKEQRIESIALDHNGPYRVFWYEESLIPELFRENTDINRSFEEYKVSAHGDGMRCRQFVEKLRGLYTDIRSGLQLEDWKNPKVKYWLRMEDAFLFFCQGQYDEAIKIYEEITKGGTDQYVPFFRLGEIHFIRGEIERALVAFDESEDLLLKFEEGDRKIADSYRLKVKLANIYWLIGKDYCDIALNEIMEAEAVFKEKPELFSEKDKLSLRNNLCWYSLEKYILSKEEGSTDAEEAYQEAKRRFDNLKELLNDPDAPSNSLDTASWFCYHSYLKTDDRQWLEQAKKYCTDALERRPATTLTIASSDLQRSHIQTIMAA